MFFSRSRGNKNKDKFLNYSILSASSSFGALFRRYLFFLTFFSSFYRLFFRFFRLFVFLVSLCALRDRTRIARHFFSSLTFPTATLVAWGNERRNEPPGLRPMEFMTTISRPDFVTQIVILKQKYTFERIHFCPLFLSFCYFVEFLSRLLFFLWIFDILTLTINSMGYEFFGNYRKLLLFHQILTWPWSLNHFHRADWKFLYKRHKFSCSIKFY